MKKSIALIASLIISFASTDVTAQASMSDKLTQRLTESADQQFDAELVIDDMLVSGLTDELFTNDVTLATRINELSEPLNQLIIAESLILSGNWGDLGTSPVRINSFDLSDVQLTVAYYGAGKSNFHALIDKLKALQKNRYQKASNVKTSIVWAVENIRFENVTVNLFDRGEPIASVFIPEFTLENINQDISTNEQVKRLIFPVMEQLISQWQENRQNLQIDAPAVMRFLLRETLAQKL